MQNKKSHLSSWIAMCFCFILFAGLLSACGGGSTQASDKPTPTPKPTMAPTPTPTPVPTKTFKGDTYTFSYSPDWELKQTANTVVLSSKTSGNDALSVATAPTGGQQANLAKGIDATLTVIKAGGSNYQEDPSAPKTVQIGGATWQQKAATMDLEKQPVKVYVLATQHGKVVYLMDYIVSKATADQDTKQYVQPVLNSFKFLS